MSKNPMVFHRVFSTAELHKIAVFELRKRFLVENMACEGTYTTIGPGSRYIEAECRIFCSALLLKPLPFLSGSWLWGCSRNQL